MNTIGECNSCGKIYPVASPNIGYFCGAMIEVKDKDGKTINTKVKCYGVVVLRNLEASLVEHFHLTQS